MRNGGVKYFFTVLGVLFWISSSAGRLEPKGEFLLDSVKIGEEVAYTFSFRYPAELTVLFPDSTYNFFPFELSRKNYFPTYSDSIYNIDSVVYFFTTFEIDTTQYLRLPVFIIGDSDSSVVFSKPDSIELIHIVNQIPEDPKLKENAAFVPVEEEFNYPMFLVVMAVVIVVVLIIALFYGKRIYKRWKIFMLKRTHNSFTKHFSIMIRDVGSSHPSVKIEHVLAVWKQYMEKLERKPFAKMTTREITQLYTQPELKEHLRYIDRTIYGSERSSVLFTAFDYLLKYSIERYHNRREEIRNG